MPRLGRSLSASVTHRYRVSATWKIPRERSQEAESTLVHSSVRSTQVRKPARAPGAAPLQTHIESTAASLNQPARALLPPRTQKPTALAQAPKTAANAAR